MTKHQVTLTMVVEAESPIHAVDVFAQNVGRPGADKFQVQTEGESAPFMVDIGLLTKMGFVGVNSANDEEVETQEEAEEKTVTPVILEEAG